jgi:hypothetical protein
LVVSALNSKRKDWMGMQRIGRMLEQRERRLIGAE